MFQWFLVCSLVFTWFMFRFVGFILWFIEVCVFCGFLMVCVIGLVCCLLDFVCVCLWFGLTL